MRTETAPSWPVSIFIAGDYEAAHEACQRYCDDVGLCVTVTRTSYVYTGGAEGGIIVGLINYPRFPSTADTLFERAVDLGNWLRRALKQESFSVQTPTATTWFSWREADIALAAATGTAKTAKQAECEASQSGPKGNAQ
jgi:hypothetical protein